MSERLKIITEGKIVTHESWLEAHTADDWHFGVRFDGCVHVHTPVMVADGEEERDYIHICDLAGFISDLQELHAKAKAHFGEKWP